MNKNALNPTEDQIKLMCSMLKSLIYSCGLTINSFADICGIGPTTISRLIKGRTEFDKTHYILFYYTLYEYSENIEYKMVVRAMLDSINNLDDIRNNYKPLDETISNLRRCRMENLKLAEIIFKLEDMHPWKEVKPLLDELHKNGKVRIDEFEICQETYCWTIWKDTDLGEHPEYKGEPLLKIVPKFLQTKEEILKFIEMSSWHYL